MVAYHYPPVMGSSGVHRTLQFSRHLPRHGWQPTILTVQSRAYRQISLDQMASIPPEVHVERAFSLDASRHLSIGGYHPLLFALPDSWSSWFLDAVRRGSKLIRRNRPDVIWSTFPIPTAHLIGATLQQQSDIPWVADFRDSMTEDDYPVPRMRWKAYRWIERISVRRCVRAVFTTPGTCRMYAQRYPEIPETRWVVIPNGYDEEDFDEAERSVAKPRSAGNPLVLVHSGLLYPSERDPRSFFAALARLLDTGEITPGSVKIVLRAAGYKPVHQEHIRQHRLEKVVHLEPPLPYREALKEMLLADGLLVFQASNCNHQVPAKVYEYLRCRRPILALTDPVGDTASVLREAGVDSIVRLDSVEEIVQFLPRFLASCRAGTAPLPSVDFIRDCSRAEGARRLASILDEIVEK